MLETSSLVLSTTLQFDVARAKRQILDTIEFG